MEKIIHTTTYVRRWMILIIMMIKIIIIVVVIFLLSCGKNPQTKQAEIKPNGCAPYEISEKCIALFVYGLLSNDEYDVPFGGACTDIAPDSLVNFLQTQKRIFKSSTLNDKIDAVKFIKEIETKPKESMSCGLSDCITLLTYGLLSDDEIDIPTDGVCQNIVSDSIVRFLQLPKRVFKRWQKDGTVDAKEIVLGRYIDKDIGLLMNLVDIRVKIGPTSIINDKTGSCDNLCDNCGGYRCEFDWATCAFNILEIFGGDYSFIWKMFLLGDTQVSLNEDTLSLSEYHIRSKFKELRLTHSASSGWCKYMEKYVQELKKYSNDDYFIKYYDSNCQDE